MTKDGKGDLPSGFDKWDERFLEVARLAANWSKDPKAKVGAVIVNSQRAITAVSYNGFPIKVEDTEERLGDPDLKLEMVVHAEQNAVIAAGTSARGGTAYVFGKPVCARCAGVLIQAGVTKVVATPPRQGTDSKWDKVGLIARQMFSEAGVSFLSASREGGDPKPDEADARRAGS